MANNILPVSPIISTVASATAGVSIPSGGDAFQQVFHSAIQNVESFQQNAQHSINQFLSGEGEEVHKVALSAEQADLSFQLFLQVRNKVVSAYQEVMRMQI